MAKNEYIPEPADTAGIELTEDLLQLGEVLAKNVHEVWAAARVAEGWSKGPRNDELKHHPCLIPYEELPEMEKDYDRRTSVETLKFILSKGYRIVK